MAEISEVTRRDIIDRIWDWVRAALGRSFLSRLYDLSALPSDVMLVSKMQLATFGSIVSPFSTGMTTGHSMTAVSICFTDPARISCFLCETVHPLVRPETAEAEKMVDQYNQYLKQDGWELIVIGEISGRREFTAHDSCGH